MATGKLIGTDTDPTTAYANVYIRTNKFTAEATGSCSEIRIYVMGNGNVRVAIYQDNSGQPSNLLAESASTAVTANQWNTVALTSALSLVSGTAYWLAQQEQTSSMAAGRVQAGAFQMRYRAYSYAAFPNPIGTVLTANQYEFGLQGYGILIVTPSGIDQPTVYGSPQLNLFLMPSGIAQAIVIGSPAVVTAGQGIQPSGIEQLVALGTPTVINLLQILYPSGIAQAIAVGTPAVQPGAVIIAPSGIEQLVDYGAPALSYPQTLSPPGIEQPTACGVPTTLKLYEYHRTSTSQKQVRGLYWRAQQFKHEPEAFYIKVSKLNLYRVGNPGTGTVSIKAVDGDGKPTGADLCSISIDGNSLPTAADWQTLDFSTGANLAINTTYAIVLRFPSGDTSNYVMVRHHYTGTYPNGAYVESADGGSTWTVYTDTDLAFETWGIPSTAPTISPSGIEQPVALGTPQVIPGAGIIYPSGIAQTIVYGTPTLIYPQTLSPSGIAQLVVFGTPVMIVPGFIYPPGIEQIVVLGTPTLIYPQTLSPQGISQVIIFGTAALFKLLNHVILDGQYATETPRINRAYVIGRDIYGNPVYGTAVDSTELGLVGERLDFQQELAVPTEAKAGDVASAILAKMRLSGKGGVILIPPNCGQELFDVVQVTDTQGNQSAVKFRVVGIRFEYNPKQARYQHKLILGAP